MATKIGSLFGDVSLRTTGLEKGIKKANRMLYRFGRNAQQTGKNITAGVGIPVTALGVTTFKTFSNFQQEMAKVEAISGATGDEFIRLEKLAKDLGASTRFTATQVSALQLNLSKLGFSTKEIEGATGAILNLSLATGEDLAESARVSAQVLRAFGISADDTTRVTDVMAKSFSSSALDLMKFDTAMANVGAIAKTTGVSLEEVSAMLAVLVDRGIDASSAGTGLRNMFLKLEKHGLTMAEALDQINNSTRPASKALKLFGIRGVTVGQTIARNVEQVKSLREEFKKAGGSAEQMASIMDDTLTGSFFKVQSATEGVFIRLGDMTKHAVKPFLDRLANFIQVNQKAIASLLRLTLIIGGLVTVLGVALLAFGTLALAIKGTLALVTMIGLPIILIGLKFLAIATVITIVVGKLIGFGNLLKILMNPIETISFAFKSLGMRIMNLSNMFVSAGEVIGAVMYGIFDVVKAVVQPVSDLLAGLAIALQAMTNITDPQAMLAGLKEATRIIKGGLAGAFNLEDERNAFNESLAKVKGSVGKFAKDVGKDFTETSKKIDQNFENIGKDGTEATEKLKAKLKELKEALAGGFLDAEGKGFFGGFVLSWLEASESIANETKILAKDMEKIFKKASDNMTDSFVKFFNEGKFGMREMVSDMLKQLQRLIIQRAIVNPILSKTLGFIGENLGIPMQENVEPRANGGSVSAGKPYLVGERGMEMFVPKSAGTIVPNHAMGGQGVVVNFNVEATDANSFDIQIAQREQMIVGMIESAFNRQGKVGIYG